MPASSRVRDLLGGGPRTSAALLPGPAGLDGWPTALANGLYGGYLSAVADSDNSRVRVDLYWPGVSAAVIERVHADGSSYPVRGGDPALMCTGWARWDYEAPLDAEVYYRATSVDADGAQVTTVPVTVGSGGRHWLKAVTQPALNLRITIRDKGSREQDARRGVLRPPLRPDPIVVYQVRQSDSGTITIYAPDRATEDAIRAVLNSGGPVMLQYPAAAGGESLYVSVDKTSRAGVTRITVELQSALVMPFDVTGWPPGDAEGGAADQYGEISADFYTYSQVAGSAATYLDLSMRTG